MSSAGPTEIRSSCGGGSSSGGGIFSAGVLHSAGSEAESAVLPVVLKSIPAERRPINAFGVNSSPVTRNMKNTSCRKEKGKIAHPEISSAAEVLRRNHLCPSWSRNRG